MYTPLCVGVYEFTHTKWLRVSSGGRSQDGRGTGRGDHFLFYKFIERTTEQRTKFTKQLLITSGGHQAPRKAAHCFQREGKKFVFLFSVFCFYFSSFFFLFFLFFFLFFLSYFLLKSELRLCSLFCDQSLAPLITRYQLHQLLRFSEPRFPHL